MKMSNLRPIMGLVLTVIMPMTQIHAQEVHADLVMLEEALASVENIDLNDKGLVAGDTDIQKELLSADPAGDKTEKKVARVERRLLKRLPKAEAKIKKQVANMSDEEVQAHSNELGLEPNVSPREALAAEMTAKVKAAVASTAREIVTAGGVLRYVSKAKKEIREAREKKTSSDPSMSDDAVELLLVMLLVTLLVITLLYSGVVIVVAPGFFVWWIVWGPPY